MSSKATCKVVVDLPREKVWEGLRDLSRAPFYVPNLTGVEFTTEDSPKGPRAAEVRLLDG